MGTQPGLRRSRNGPLIRARPTGRARKITRPGRRQWPGTSSRTPAVDARRAARDPQNLNVAARSRTHPHIVGAGRRAVSACRLRDGGLLPKSFHAGSTLIGSGTRPSMKLHIVIDNRVQAVGSNGASLQPGTGVTEALLHASLTADRKSRFQFTSKPSAPSRAARGRPAGIALLSLRSDLALSDEPSYPRLVVVDTRRLHAAESAKLSARTARFFRSTPWW